MLIARAAESAHWYLPTGEPFYQIAKKDGTGYRSTTIRDAFAAGALRSVTNVLSVVAKPGLVNWRIEQAILSAITLPHLPAESEHEFAERCIIDAEEQGKKAAERGTQLHQAAADYLANPAAIDSWTVEDGRVMAPFVVWAQANIKFTIASEKVVLNHYGHYAGRLDLAYESQSGIKTILDIKTQDVKRNPKGEFKPAFYDEWAMQLGAYSWCRIGDVTPGSWRLKSLVLDRNGNGVFQHDWPESPSHFQAFQAACELWSYLKGGTPGEKPAKALSQAA